MPKTVWNSLVISMKFFRIQDDDDDDEDVEDEDDDWEDEDWEDEED